MNIIQFIDSNYVKLRCNINENVNSKLIDRVIVESQEMDILPLLGEILYDRLKDDIDNDTLAGVYKVLLETYVAPVLAYRVYQRLIYSLGFKIAEGNVYRSESENGSAVTNTELSMLSRNAAKIAETYSDRLVKFLCNRTSEIPEYLEFDQDKVGRYRNNIYNGLSLDGVHIPRMTEYKDKNNNGQL
jgi:hypothetical protein